jgi:replicative DNA helicase
MSAVHAQFPPHSIEAEQAVLGAMLMSAVAVSTVVAGKLRREDFYRLGHQLIYGAIVNLHAERKAADPVTVSEYLERHGSDTCGLSYLGGLVRDTPGEDNIEHYAAIVRERSTLRQFEAFGKELIGAAASGLSAVDLIASAQEQLQRLQTSARTGKGLVDARQLIGELVDDLDSRVNRAGGLQIGLPDFDERTNGLEPGDLVIFAARPSVGKTSVMVSMASNVSETTGTAVFSAEMPSHQIMRRHVAFEGSIAQGLLRRADLLAEDQWARIAKAQESIARKRLWIDDTGMPTLTHIRAECVALKSRAALGLVMIDYVQLIRGVGRNRYEELRDIAYGLKALAKELAVPIIVLAQLNRDVEARDRKRPNISDLRDSGSLEEAADIVGLLYSEVSYDPAFPMPYVLECRIAKNRNGERGECLWNFDGAMSRVSALDPGAAANYRRLLTKPNAGHKAADL